MLQKFSFLDLHAALKTHIETNTTYDCYDEVPQNKAAPFYYVECIGSTPTDTKTMFVEDYKVWIHAIAEAGNSSKDIYDMIQILEEAMTEDITIDGFTLVLQKSNGTLVIKTDETKEKHAVVGYEFKICYGYKTKV